MGRGEEESGDDQVRVIISSWMRFLALVEFDSSWSTEKVLSYIFNSKNTRYGTLCM